MYYIIQENTFREQNYNNLVTELEKLKLDYEVVKVLPFVEDVEFKTDRKDVFIFGSIKLSRLSKKYGWSPASLYNENHNFEVYKNFYKENLLNYDSIICNFEDEIDFTQRKFIRPTLDTKTFTGRVFDYYEWQDFKKNAYTNGSSLTPTTKIQVSSVKQIYNETRFWIVNKKIITYSLYKQGNQVIYNRSFVSPDAIKFCENVIQLFQLADAFVIDICLTDNGYKIVEAGCINCAGFYDCDMNKLLIALENHYTI